MGLIGQVMRLMLEFYVGDTKRINHFMKVYGFSKANGWMKKRSSFLK